MQSLGTSSLPDDPGSASYANDASADGSVIVGSDPIEGAYRWTLVDGAVGLGVGIISQAAAVSADGSVVVGSSLHVPSVVHIAYRWTESDGIVTLGTLPGTTASGASAVSGDGTVVVGASGVPTQPGAQGDRHHRHSDGRKRLEW